MLEATFDKWRFFFSFGEFPGHIVIAIPSRKYRCSLRSVAKFERQMALGAVGFFTIRHAVVTVPTQSVSAKEVIFRNGAAWWRP